MNIKEFISNNLLDKNGKFNNRTTFLSWWQRRNLMDDYYKIMELTNHLPEDAIMTRRIYDIMNDITEIQLCEVCEENPKLFDGYLHGYNFCCSLQCCHRSKRIKEKKANSKMEKYGDPYYRNMELAAENNLKKYGVKWTTQTQNFKDKSKQTKIERYGDENYCNREQAKFTNLERYGTEYTCQAPEVIKKIQEKKTINCPQLRDKEWLITENKTKSITQIASELGVTYRTVYLWYKKFDIDIIFYYPDYSKLQKEIYDFVAQFTEVKLNDRNAIKPKEIDILVESKKFGIELNGVYWHAEDEKKHAEKLMLCKDKGIKLIQFWDHEWLEKKQLCQSIIKANLGLNDVIHARKCQIKTLDNSVYRDFLENNHIQGFVPASIKLGLFHDDDLVAVMSFGKPRFNKQFDWELLRYCNKINHNVVGGFSKLLKFANLSNVISYCDLRLFDGNIYTKCGFEFVRQSKPNFFFYRKGIILTRLQCQKHNAKKHLQSYDENKSVHENMSAEGWLKVYDCGNAVYVKN